jgi:sporulation protein YlmC with PRC-barrel domain
MFDNELTTNVISIMLALGLKLKKPNSVSEHTEILSIFILGNIMNTAIQNTREELHEKQQEVIEKQQELNDESYKVAVKQDEKHNEVMQMVSRASSIISTTVKNSSGDDLGDIKDLVLDPLTGNMVYAVVAFGGVFGLGDKYFAIPWRALQWSHDNHYYTLNVDKGYLEKAPGFDKDHWPESSNNWEQVREELEQFYSVKQS